MKCLTLCRRPQRSAGWRRYRTHDCTRKTLRRSLVSRPPTLASYTSAHPGPLPPKGVFRPTDLIGCSKSRFPYARSSPCGAFTPPGESLLSLCRPRGVALSCWSATTTSDICECRAVRGMVGLSCARSLLPCHASLCARCSREGSWPDANLGSLGSLSVALRFASVPRDPAADEGLASACTITQHLFLAGRVSVHHPSTFTTCSSLAVVGRRQMPA